VVGGRDDEIEDRICRTVMDHGNMREIGEMVTWVVRLMVTWTFYPTIRTPNNPAQCLACTTCFTIAQLPGGQCWIANRGS
jgi:hypothetical protein